MFRFFILFFNIFLLSSFANSEFKFFTPYSAPILSINEPYIAITDSKNIVVGSTGVVMHKVGNSKTITALVTVAEKKNGIATLEITDYFKLDKTSFPRPILPIQKGDIVHLNYLYQRALLITPNYESFLDITNRFQDVEWIHPDILASYLAKKFRPNPTKKEFQSMCNKFSAGLILFAISNKAYFVDCQSFNVLTSFNIKDEGEQMKPFYSRISNLVDKSWVSWGSTHMKDYTSYYKELLGI